MTLDYKNRVRGCFKIAYEQLEKHHGAETSDDFSKAHEEFRELSKQDDFLMRLLLKLIIKD